MCKYNKQGQRCTCVRRERDVHICHRQVENNQTANTSKPCRSLLPLRRDNKKRIVSGFLLCRKRELLMFFVLGNLINREEREKKTAAGE